MDILDKGCSLLYDMTIHEMYLFLPITVKIGHEQRQRLKDYWSTLEPIFMSLYRNTIKEDRVFHILRLTYFSENKIEPDKTYENYEGQWKKGTIFHTLKNACTTYYNPAKQSVKSVCISKVLVSPLSFS
jgi:hypothetical protein